MAAVQNFRLFVPHASDGLQLLICVDRACTDAFLVQVAAAVLVAVLSTGVICYFAKRAFLALETAYGAAVWPHSSSPAAFITVSGTVLPRLVPGARDIALCSVSKPGQPRACYFCRWVKHVCPSLTEQCSRPCETPWLSTAIQTIISPLLTVASRCLYTLYTMSCP